jgi:2',3'-cyclic-nucleotide 2'-phosphodiesterase (5'-nucleotidase family)
LRLLYTNDVHGTLSPVPDQAVSGRHAPLGGSAHLASLVKMMRAQDPTHTLLVDAGDSVDGYPATDLDQGRSMAEVMRKIGYEVATIGNHDFRWGVGPLEDRMRISGVPTVIANVGHEDGRPLGSSVPFTLRQMGETRVGLVGILTTDTRQQARSEQIAGVRFEDEVATLRQVIPQVRAAGADLVVVLSHCGLERDRKLAAAFPGEGLLIVGAHSHDRTPDPVQVAGNYIVQAGSQGKELGHLQVEVDLATARPVRVEHRLIPVDADRIAPDPQVAALVAGYEQKAHQAMGQVVASIPLALTRSNHRDSPLGNAFTDAMREATGAQLAFINSDGLRADLPAGKVTRGQIHQVMPFGGRLMLGRVSGKAILTALEDSVARRQTEPGRQSSFLQVSGLSMRYDASRPEGRRVYDVRVGGRPLDLEARYSVALDDYLCFGKPAYTSFTEASFEDTGKTLPQAFESWIRQGRLRLAEQRIADDTDRPAGLPGVVQAGADPLAEALARPAVTAA